MLDTQYAEAFAAARALHESRKFAEAEYAYRKLYAQRANDTNVILNIGVMLFAQGRHDDAIEMLERALRINPDFALAHNARGAALAAAQYIGAIDAFRRAAELAPDDATILGNYGQSLIGVACFEEAEGPLRRCVELRPDNVGARINLAGALWGQRRYHEAEQLYRSCVALNPEAANAQTNLGICCLQRGAYAEGWERYEWRWQSDRVAKQHQNFPTWNGGPIEGALLVWPEQGLGDQILHLGMLRDLVRRGVQVVWECDERMIPLIQRSYPQARCIPRYGFVPRDVVAQIPAGSLGQFLRKSPEDFPAELSYLKPDPEKVAVHRAYLQERAPGARLVGICWRSVGTALGAHKSTQLSDWHDVLGAAGHHFVSLQHSDMVIATNVTSTAVDLRDDIDGLAALICACDEVITISSAVGHLAGALGVPTTILVPGRVRVFWYYGRDGEQCAWYPMVTLVRQGRDQPWSELLSQVGRELAAGEPETAA